VRSRGAGRAPSPPSFHRGAQLERDHGRRHALAPSRGCQDFRGLERAGTRGDQSVAVGLEALMLRRVTPGPTWRRALGEGGEARRAPSRQQASRGSRQFPGGAAPTPVSSVMRVVSSRGPTAHLNDDRASALPPPRRRRTTRRPWPLRTARLAVASADADTASASRLAGYWVQLRLILHDCVHPPNDHNPQGLYDRDVNV